MNGNKPIYWYEGLFLRPQHFQQIDAYHAEQLHNATRFFNPFNWGLMALALPQARLNNQIFDLEQCSLVFQDGSVVHVPGNGRIKSRSFEGRWETSGAPLSVYLGLRHNKPGEANASDKAKEAVKSVDPLSAPRYLALGEDAPTYDMFAPDNKDVIPRLTYNVQVLFGNEAAEAADFDLIKVAELQRFGNEVKLIEDYIPPFVSVNGSSQLGRILRDVREQLTTRARELALYKQDRGIESAEFNSKDMVYLLALRTLNRYVPQLVQLLDEANATPWQIYSLLRQLTGELSTFSSRYDLFGARRDSTTDDSLPAYKHETPGAGFRKIAKIITDLMEEITAGPDYTAALLFDGTYFYADVDPRALQGRNRYYLSVKTGLPDDYVVSSVAPLMKIAAREILPLLIARSLPGIRLDYLASPPTVLPRRTNTLYFELDNTQDVWSSIKEGNNIAAYLDNPPADLEMELMVVYG